jgi:hypothetical protein
MDLEVWMGSLRGTPSGTEKPVKNLFWKQVLFLQKNLQIIDQKPAKKPAKNLQKNLQKTCKKPAKNLQKTSNLLKF